MARHVAKPHQFPSLDGGEDRFLWAHQALDLAPDELVGLAVAVRDVQDLPQAFHFEGLDFALGLCEERPCFTSVQENGEHQRFV